MAIVCCTPPAYNTYCKINTIPYTLNTTHYTLHTTHYTLYIAYDTLHTTHYTLHTTHYTLYIAYDTLHTTHYTSHTTHYTLNTTHCTLHTIHCIMYRVHILSHIERSYQTISNIHIHRSMYPVYTFFSLIILSKIQKLRATLKIVKKKYKKI